MANAVRSLVLLSLPYFVMAAGCTPAGSQAVFPDLRQAGATGSTSTSPAATAPASPGIPVLASRLSWQIQYSGELDPETDVDLFNLDLFETPGSFIDELHRDGVFVVCYFSAGSYEDWRPDSPEFPPEVLGEKLAGWPGERWLDITRLDLLAPIMEARLDLAVRKECDGVDPDNVNGYQNATGFALSADNQLAYNIFLSQAAHVRGLAIGLKNDLGQVTDLLPYFEWMLNEECFSYQECSLLLPFVEAGKPVFVIEYDLSPDEFCEQAERIGFNAQRKNWELDASTVDCRSFVGGREGIIP